jgi:hypothetical protein
LPSGAPSTVTSSTSTQQTLSQTAPYSYSNTSSGNYANTSGTYDSSTAVSSENVQPGSGEIFGKGLFIDVNQTATQTAPQQSSYPVGGVYCGDPNFAAAVAQKYGSVDVTQTYTDAGGGKCELDKMNLKVKWTYGSRSYVGSTPSASYLNGQTVYQAVPKSAAANTETLGYLTSVTTQNTLSASSSSAIASGFTISGGTLHSFVMIPTATATKSYSGAPGFTAAYVYYSPNGSGSYDTNVHEQAAYPSNYITLKNHPEDFWYY